MPELPEVELITRGLRRAIKGRTVRRGKVLFPNIVNEWGLRFQRGIRGMRVESVDRRGKNIVTGLSRERYLIFHLGMSGRILLSQPSQPIEKHTHLILCFERGDRELRYIDPRRFGSIDFGRGDPQCHPRVASLGPEPFDLSADEFVSMLRSGGRQVKAFLLDQHAIAGIGNIYADEALFRARLHPQQTTNSISARRGRRLFEALIESLREAIRGGGSTLRDYVRPDGRLGRFQDRHLVYGREGLPCSRCGRSIVRRVMCGRSTHFCRHCQRVYSL